MASAFSFDVSHSQGLGFKLYAYLGGRIIFRIKYFHDGSHPPIAKMTRVSHGMAPSVSVHLVAAETVRVRPDGDIQKIGREPHPTS